MMVSMKVWVIDTRPCRTGCRVCAAAAAIAAEPRPDSFENIPRATPNWIAAATPAPTNPPVAAVPVNASLNTRARALGISPTFSTSTSSPPATYSTIINGTNPAVTRPIDLIPPIRTTAANTAITTPETQAGTPKVPSTEAATVFAWVMFPIPKLASTANTANRMDSTSPNLFGIALAR